MNLLGLKSFIATYKIYLICIICHSNLALANKSADNNYSPNIHQPNFQTENYFLDYLASTNFIKLLQQIEETSENILGFHPVCSTCKFTLESIYKIMNSKPVFWVIYLIADYICPLFAPYPLCSQGARVFAPLFYTNAIAKFTYSNFICPYLKLCTTPKLFQLTKEAFRDKVLKGKPPRARPKPIPGAPTIKILAFADSHVDPRYQEGKSGTCKYPICCREGDNEATEASDRAGKFGFLGKCDLPLATLGHFLETEVVTHKPDIIVWMGDNNAHNLWEQKKETHLDSAKYIADRLLLNYPNIGQVYPIIGNHECLPADNYDVWGNKTNWIQDGLADIFKPWLTAQSYELVKNQGCFSQMHPGTNLRIITLVPWVYYVTNSYLWQNSTDVWGNLEWLIEELQFAEDNQQNVLIIGHNPPSSLGSDREWGYRFRVIVDRYTNIIRGLLFGHTHQDTWQTFNSFTDNLPAGIAQIIPSFGTFSYLNPSFRIYQMEGGPHSSFVLLDQTTYRLYLGEVNYFGSPVWDVAYSFNLKYNTTSLEPDQFVPLNQKIITDVEFYKDLLYYIFAEGPIGPEEYGNQYAQRFWYCYFSCGSFWELDTCTEGHYPVSEYSSEHIVDYLALTKWRIAQF